MHDTAAIPIYKSDLEKKFFKYFAIAKANYHNQTVYFGDWISLGIMVAFRVWVLSQLYFVTYRTAGSSVKGLTLGMAVWSLMLVQSFQLASSTRLTILKFQDDIKSGDLAYTLNRPISYLGFVYFSNIGRIFSRLMPELVCGSIAALVLVGPIAVSWQGVLGAFILCILGFSLNMLLSMMIGLFSFWTEDVSAFRWALDKMQWAFGGMVIPIALFPEGLRKVVELSPIGQIFYAPARIFVGFDGGLFIKYLLAQAVWILLFLLIVNLQYRKGIKNVSINGG